MYSIKFTRMNSMVWTQWIFHGLHCQEWEIIQTLIYKKRQMSCLFWNYKTWYRESNCHPFSPRVSPTLHFPDPIWETVPLFTMQHSCKIEALGSGFTKASKKIYSWDHFSEQDQCALYEQDSFCIGDDQSY